MASGNATVAVMNVGSRGARTVVLALALGVLITGEAAAEHAPLTREAVVAAAERAPAATKGADSAPVTIVGLSDFQCGYCRTFWAETLPTLEGEYLSTGKVPFVYRHLVVLGPASQHAAEAAECAGERGKFWAYHDALFERRGQLPDARATEAMGLDADAFRVPPVRPSSGGDRRRVGGGPGPSA